MHRHKMQWFEMIYTYLGWLARFIGLLACVTAATYLALHDHDGVAAGMLGVPSLGVIGWFIRSGLNDPEDSRPAQDAMPSRSGPKLDGRKI